MNTVLSGKSYLDEFDPKVYLADYYATSEGSSNEGSTAGFHRHQVYDFYAKYNSKWNSKTARLLEFGGGPVIKPLISAAPYVDQITFAAYAESERREIELWKHEKEGAHDWSSHFKNIVNEVEHIAGDDAWREREKLLRKRISSIVPCDILNENPLLVKQEPFEIISTHLCLEAACLSYAEYIVSIKKLVGLLKPGGFLLMLIVERQTFYMVGRKKWFTLYLTLEQIKEALAKAGMEIVIFVRDPAKMKYIQEPKASDYTAFVFVAAQKVEF